MLIFHLSDWVKIFRLIWMQKNPKEKQTKTLRGILQHKNYLKLTHQLR